MADNTGKGILKSTAEVVATTSTILVAGKTIASVIDSTATSLKDLYEEKNIVKTQDDIQTGELIKEETTTSGPSVLKKIIKEPIVQTSEYISVKEEINNTEIEGNSVEDTISEEGQVEIISTESPYEETNGITEDIISTEENLTFEEEDIIPEVEILDREEDIWSNETDMPNPDVDDWLKNGIYDGAYGEKLPPADVFVNNGKYGVTLEELDPREEDVNLIDIKDFTDISKW